MMRGLQRLLDETSRQGSLAGPGGLRARLDALDRLDACLPDRADRPDAAWSTSDAALLDRADALRARLEAANARVFDALRRDIRRGAGAAALRRWAAALRTPPETDRRVDGAADDDRYDALDALVSGVLRFAPPPACAAELGDEMVAFQPTPARHVFALIERTAPGAHDVLVDLGSGLGHVPLLVAICTDARAVGVELDAAWVDCARRSARALGLRNVAFVAQDARAADLSTGTVFYLYTPFTGGILRSVLDALRREAAARAIRVCTYGPCTPIVAAEGWLQVDGTAQPDRIAVFRSRG